MLSGVPFVRVTRGALVESVHSVAACASDVHGNVILALGDIDEPVYLRSAAKPFIAAAAVRAGAADRFALDDRELSVMTASHNGEFFHVAAVQSILKKIGASAADLQCGVHAISYEPAAAELAARGEKPTVLHNNCSGKHAGILALCRMLDAPLEGYLAAEHPAQRAILALCERVSDDRFGDDRLGVDGCGIPVYATSLRNAARSFARFAALTEIEPADAAALARIRAATIAEPAYIAGTARFDTDLIRAGGGRIACKAGAEGVHASALLDGGIGLVLKVIDGTRRAASPAAVALLQQLGALDAAQLATLAAHARVAVKNAAGVAVGEVSALQPLPAP
ncbi:MAG: asparaginase [Candidatus Velthaea sp.]